MNCDDIDNAIYVYLDGEFAELEQRDFEAHVEACARCRRLTSAEAVSLGHVKRAAPAMPAPEGLRARVLAALDAAPPPLPRETPAPRRSRATAALAAATVLAAAALLAVGVVASSGPDPSARVVTEAVAAHQTNLPMEVRGSERQIRLFLEENVPFAVEVPFDGDPRVRLTGARLTRVDGRPAVLFNYDLDGERVSVIQTAAHPDEGEADAEPAVASRQGFDVMTFRRRGVTHSVVGAGAHPGVRRLVQAAYQR